MSNQTAITTPTATPQHLTPPNHTPETPSSVDHSPIATPASSRPSSVYSHRGRGSGRTAPPNSVSGVAPYGAFSKGVDRSDLRYMTADYEHIWKDPHTTPRTSSPHVSPPLSSESLPADKFDKLLATIPEALDSLPTPRYYTPSKYSCAETVISDPTSVSDGESACYLKIKSKLLIYHSKDSLQRVYC